MDEDAIEEFWIKKTEAHKIRREETFAQMEKDAAGDGIGVVLPTRLPLPLPTFAQLLWQLTWLEMRREACAPSERL
jgi:hypothetical protein